MNRITFVSRFFRIFFALTAISVPVVVAVYWIGVCSGALPLNWQFELLPIKYPDPSTFTLMHQILIFCIFMIPVGFLMINAYILMKLFRLYENGFYFTHANVRYFFLSGLTLLLRNLVFPFSQLLLSYSLTYHLTTPIYYFKWNEAGISASICALLVMLVAWIMNEGRKLQEDHDLTI